MTVQRISDRRMIVRGALTALFCGCWLLAGLAAGQETEPRRRKAPPPPAAVKKSTKQERHTTIYHLKYAEAESVASVLSIMADDDTKIAVALETNSIILAAPPQMQEQLAGLIEELDVPGDRMAGRELRVFRLERADPEEAAAVISTLFARDNISIAVDRRTDSVVVQAQMETLERIQAIFEKLDTAADKNLTRYGPETTFRVRVVWLATIDADGPADDLKDVVGLLSKVGVKGLRQVGQVIVNTTPDGRFRVRCAPILDHRSSYLEISGEFDKQQETPTLKIQVSATQPKFAPSKEDSGGFRGETTLVDLDTVIAAPLGHYVVLGVTPIDKMTSVFIVQITAGK